MQRGLQDSVSISKLNNTIENQDSKIADLKHQNDSLIIKQSILENMLAGTDKKVEIGFSDNKFDLAQIKSKVGTTKKIITEEQKQYLISKLASIKNFKVPIQYSAVSSLNSDYAIQLKDIFNSAGLNSYNEKILGGYTSRSEMKGIVLIIRNKNNYPKEADVILNAMYKAKFQINYFIDDKATHDFFIYIGD